MAQTVSNGKRRILGSAKVEVAAYGSDTWYDLGLGEGVGWTEGFKQEETIPDNGASLGIVILDQFADIDFIVWEPDLAVLKIARGNIDNTIVTAGTEVSGYEQVVASGGWSYNHFIEFTGQNATGTQPTLDVTHPVVAGTNGDLTQGTDFEVVQYGSKWGIIVKDSVTVTTLSQTITIKYTYTPAASVTLTTGGADVPGFLKLRLTNVTSGKTTTFTFHKAQNTTGFSVKMNADSGTAKPDGFVLKFHCVCDATRDSIRELDQLYSWYKEE